jgi:Domain of unknown function (DUF4112)
VIDRSVILDKDRRLVALRRLKLLLDEAYRVPGTNIRFGWDALVGLVPWVGDLTTALMACGIIVQAHQMRVPRVVQLRMIMNVAVDMFIGLVPFLGDVADVFWKSNTKNFALLERHAMPYARPTLGDWMFVTTAVSAVLLIAIAPLIMVYWIVHSMMRSGLLPAF